MVKPKQCSKCGKKLYDTFTNTHHNEAECKGKEVINPPAITYSPDCA